MFKSLLRTIPTMSGNFKINCSLTDNKRIDKENFESYIRVADISPLQNILLNRNIKISLLNGSYEYDVCKYFKYYSNKFYSDNYTFDKSDYQILDLYSDNRLDSRNKDYEFGCKRLPFSQTEYQMNFYAPIWCDNINDLPDYFTINLKVGNIEKNIKIYIGKYHIKNYLKIYLEKYINKIDNNVITLNQGSKSAVYYGVDVNKGGINAFNDFIISKIFTTQLTQNEFDDLITSGFKRNNIIVRQVLPLSFSFNLMDFFTKNELSYFYYSPISIKGSYNTLNINFELNDFDIDYYNFNLDKRIYNSNSLNFDTIISSKNLLDQNFPGLREKRNIQYKYDNKLSPLYNRWVLLNYDKYYINNSNLYDNILSEEDVKQYGDNYLSFIQNNYMEFPNDLYTNLPFGLFVNGDNMIIPFGNNLDNINYESIWGENVQTEKKKWIGNYITFMNNYLTNWFNIYPLEKDGDGNYTINNINYKELLFNGQSTWGDVNNNEIYFNGILYDFNKILKNVEGNIKIDKFNVFINPILENVENTNSQYYIRGIINKDNNKLNNCKINLENTPDTGLNNYIIPEGDKGASIIDYVYYDTNYLSIVNNKTGKYVKLENYYNNNVYYDFYSFIDKIKTNLSINKNLLSDFSNYKYNGDVLLPFDNYNNLNNDKNEFVYKDYFIFTEDTFKDIEEGEQESRKKLQNFIIDNIKYSKSNDPNKYNLTINSDVFDGIKNSIKYLYISKHLISSIQIKNCVVDYFGYISNEVERTKSINDTIDSIFNDIKSLETFEYIPLIKDGDKNLKDYFICSSWSKDILYYQNNDKINNDNYKNYCILIDVYNLQNLRNSLIQYGYNLDSLIDINNKIKKFGRFLDREHFINYITNYNFNEITKDNPVYIYNKCRKTKFELNSYKTYDLYFDDVYENVFGIYKNENSIVVDVVDEYDKNQKVTYDFTEFIKTISYSSSSKMFICNGKELNLYFQSDFIPLNNKLYNKFKENENILFGLYLYTNEFDNKHYNYITKYDESIIKGITSINDSVMPLFIDFFNTENNSNYTRNLFNSNNISEYNDYYIYTYYNYPLLININLHPDFKSFVNLTINNGEFFDIDNIGKTIITEDIKRTYSNIYISIDKKVISSKYEAKELIKDIILNPDKYVNSVIIYAFLYETHNNCHKICLNISRENFNHVDDIYQFREYLIKCVLFNSSYNYTVEGILGLDDYMIYDVFKDTNISIVNKLSINNKYLDNYNNLLVYKNEDNNLTYGMYLLEVKCNKTLNIFRYKIDNNKENLLYVEKINGNNILNVFKKSFKYILPCLDIKLFTYYKTNNKSLQNLSQSQLKIFRMAKMVDDGNSKNSYKYNGIYYNENDNDKKVYSVSNIDIKNNYEIIYRYFGKITPKFITYNDNLIKNRFSLLYKSIGNYINENNIINEPLNIYGYKPIQICNKYLESNIEYIYKEEIEYKHFNDNKFYLLEPEIIIEKKDYYDYNTLLSLESKEVIFEEFKNYILKYSKSDIIDNDKLLFLFNRYKYNLLSEPVKLNLLNTGKLYKLIYKFTLK